MLLKRKNIVICSMILLLFVIGYAYNAFTTGKFAEKTYSFETSKDLNQEAAAVDEQDNPNAPILGKKDAEDATTTSSSFFSEYRLEREKTRGKEADMWEEIINNPNSEKTYKNLAQQELVKLVALTDKEMMIENLIISRGFNDALVFLTDDAATVIVDAKDLTAANVAQIQDIVCRKTKIDPANVKIMKKN